MPSPAYIGRVRWQAGSAPATVTITAGAVLLRIRARATTANGTVTIFGGKDADSGNATLTILSTDTSFTQLDFDHLGFVAGNDATTAGSADIIFGTNITSWYVEYAVPTAGPGH